jgi:hypothetical protein
LLYLFIIKEIRDSTIMALQKAIPVDFELKSGNPFINKKIV